jgi:hypothetical protein
LLLERLDPAWAIQGFDTLQDFALGQGPGLGHFTQQMEVIGHQNEVQDPDSTENLQAAHQGEKILRLHRPAL